MHPLFQPGEQVLVKAGPVPKGTSPYQGPYKVVRALVWYTFVLSDGQCCSARQMKCWIQDPLWTAIDSSREPPGDAVPQATQGPLARNEEPKGRQPGPHKMSRATAGKKPDRFGYGIT